MRIHFISVFLLLSAVAKAQMNMSVPLPQSVNLEVTAEGALSAENVAVATETQSALQSAQRSPSEKSLMRSKHIQDGIVFDTQGRQLVDGSRSESRQQSKVVEMSFQGAAEATADPNVMGKLFGRRRRRRRRKLFADGGHRRRRQRRRVPSTGNIMNIPADRRRSRRRIPSTGNIMNIPAEDFTDVWTMSSTRTFCMAFSGNGGAWPATMSSLAAGLLAYIDSDPTSTKKINLNCAVGASSGSAVVILYQSLVYNKNFGIKYGLATPSQARNIAGALNIISQVSDLKFSETAKIMSKTLRKKFF
jgi:hypothetical protein